MRAVFALSAALCLAVALAAPLEDVTTTATKGALPAADSALTGNIEGAAVQTLEGREGRVHRTHRGKNKKKGDKKKGRAVEDEPEEPMTAVAADPQRGAVMTSDQDERGFFGGTLAGAALGAAVGSHKGNRFGRSLQVLPEEPTVTAEGREGRGIRAHRKKKKGDKKGRAVEDEPEGPMTAVAADPERGAVKTTDQDERGFFGGALAGAALGAAVGSHKGNRFGRSLEVLPEEPTMTAEGREGRGHWAHRKNKNKKKADKKKGRAVEDEPEGPMTAIAADPERGAVKTTDQDERGFFGGALAGAALGAAVGSHKGNRFGRSLEVLPEEPTVTAEGREGRIIRKRPPHRKMKGDKGRALEDGPEESVDYW